MCFVFRLVAEKKAALNLFLSNSLLFLGGWLCFCRMVVSFMAIYPANKNGINGDDVEKTFE